MPEMSRSRQSISGRDSPLEADQHRVVEGIVVNAPDWGSVWVNV